jgi:hypothetical protein
MASAYRSTSRIRTEWSSSDTAYAAETATSAISVGLASSDAAYAYADAISTDIAQPASSAGRDMQGAHFPGPQQADGRVTQWTPTR